MSLGDGTAGDSEYDDQPVSRDDADQDPRIVDLRETINAIVLAAVASSQAVKDRVDRLIREGYHIRVRWAALLDWDPPEKATPIRAEVSEADKAILKDLGIAP